MNFPFICSNIPAAPVYGVHISRLIRYTRACGPYHEFCERGLLLSVKPLNQGLLLVELKSSHRKFYGHHLDLVDRYGISVSQMTIWICSTCRKHFAVLSSGMIYHRVCNSINTTGARSGLGNAYPFGAPEFTPGF